MGGPYGVQEGASTAGNGAPLARAVSAGSWLMGYP